MPCLQELLFPLARECKHVVQGGTGFIIWVDSGVAAAFQR